MHAVCLVFLFTTFASHFFCLLISNLLLCLDLLFSSLALSLCAASAYDYSLQLLTNLCVNVCLFVCNIALRAPDS